MVDNDGNCTLKQSTFQISILCLLPHNSLLLFPDPFRRIGAMAGNQRASETRQFFKAGTRSRTEKKESPKNERCKKSVARQCRRKWDIFWVGWLQAVQERLSIWRILEKQKSLTEGCVVEATTRKDTTSETKEHKFLSRYWGNLCVENLDQTVSLLSERRVNTRETTWVSGWLEQCTPLGQRIGRVIIRKEWMTGTYWSLRVNEKNSWCKGVKQKNGIGAKVSKNKARIWEKETEVAVLLVLPRPAKSLQNGAGFSRKA